MYLRAGIAYICTIFSILTLLTGNSFHYIKKNFYASTFKSVNSKLNISHICFRYCKQFFCKKSSITTLNTA